MGSKHAPVPWKYCGEHRVPSEHCQCGQIWSVPADCPVTTVIRGDWGDTYPAIKIDHPGSIGEVARPYTEKIVYGSIDSTCSNANAEFIVRACNNHDDLLAVLRDALRAFESMYDDLEQGADGDKVFHEESYWPILKIKAALTKATQESPCDATP